MRRPDIVNEARRYVELKTPWRHRGRTETGLDCVGLLVVVGRALGVKVQDYDNYSRFPTKDDQLTQHLRRQLVKAGYPLKPGNVVVMNDRRARVHVGIISERYNRPYIIHAALDRRRVFEDLLDERHAGEIAEVFDFPGVED